MDLREKGGLRGQETGRSTALMNQLLDFKGFQRTIQAELVKLLADLVGRLAFDGEFPRQFRRFLAGAHEGRVGRAHTFSISRTGEAVHSKARRFFYTLDRGPVVHDEKCMSQVALVAAKAKAATAKGRLPTAGISPKPESKGNTGKQSRNPAAVTGFGFPVTGSG